MSKSGIVNPIKTNIYAAINKIADFKGVDYSIDCAGKVKSIETSFEIINKKSGKCIFCSHPIYGEKIKLDPFHLICGKQIKGSWGGNVKPDIDIPLLADIYKENNLPLDALITKKYPLEEINNALEDIESFKVYRPIISFDQEGN